MLSLKQSGYFLSEKRKYSSTKIVLKYMYSVTPITSTMYSEEDCSRCSGAETLWGVTTWNSVKGRCRFSAGFVRGVWFSPAASKRVCESAELSPYWIGHAILGFTNNHRFGFTKVSGRQMDVKKVCYQCLLTFWSYSTLSSLSTAGLLGRMWTHRYIL